MTAKAGIMPTGKPIYPVTRVESIEEQHVYDSFQNAIASLGSQGCLFFQEKGHMMRLRHPHDHNIFQGVIFGALRAVTSVSPTTVG